MAPLIGGALQTLFGWRANFVTLLGIGVMAATSVWLFLPETLRMRAPEPVSLASTLRAYRLFIRNRSFVAHLGLASCCLGGLFAWISTAAFVLQDLYGLSALAFGLVFAVGSAGYMLGTLIAARFVTRWGMDRTMGTGALAMAAGGAGMVVAQALGLNFAGPLVLTMALYLAGMGLLLPQAQAGALLPFPERAGAASSLLGFVQQTTAAIIGAILGHLLGATAWPLAIAVAVAGFLALLLWAMTRAIRTSAYHH
jgi:DHA1 family bicyclomycin/chloramphenicol resistance-like MFS transporter